MNRVSSFVCYYLLGIPYADSPWQMSWSKKCFKRKRAGSPAVLLCVEWFPKFVPTWRRGSHERRKWSQSTRTFAQSAQAAFTFQTSLLRNLLYHSHVRVPSQMRQTRQRIMLLLLASSCQCLLPSPTAKNQTQNAIQTEDMQALVHNHYVYVISLQKPHASHFGRNEWTKSWCDHRSKSNHVYLQNVTPRVSPSNACRRFYNRLL